jgi:hypothetical protein
VVSDGRSRATARLLRRCYQILALLSWTTASTNSSLQMSVQPNPIAIVAALPPANRPLSAKTSAAQVTVDRGEVI